MMGQRSEASSDAQSIVNNLIESVMNEVINSISECQDPCLQSVESTKPQTCGNKDSSDCLALKGKRIEKIKGCEIEESHSINPPLNDICYPSLANLPEECKHSSSLSNTSKQGEGDFQAPTIREATAFYCLGMHSDLDRNTRCKGTSTSSIDTDTSHNELIKTLHNDIYNLSFDNIHLSDSDVEDKLRSSSEFYEPNKLLSATTEDPQYTDKDDSENIPNLYLEPSDSIVIQNVVQHSQKFCQLDNIQYFPTNRHTNYSLPHNYFQLVNESYEKYKEETPENEEYKLISDRSQELFIIEGEENAFLGDSSQTNPFKQALLNSHESSAAASSLLCFTDLSEKSPEDIKTMQAVVDLEPYKTVHDWEELIELETNVTEPEAKSETQIHESNDDITRTVKYWSNVGLMCETKINPQYLGPTNGAAVGIESIPNIRKVEDKCLTHEAEEVIWVTEPKYVEENESMNSISNQNTVDVVNYLSYSDKKEKEKKKRKLVSRITCAISNIFRSKKNKSKQ